MSGNGYRTRKFIIAALFLVGAWSVVGVAGQAPASGGERPARNSDCAFLQDPQRFEWDRDLHNRSRTSEINRVVRWTAAIGEIPNAGAVPRKNLIDDEIFTRMAAAGIRPAPVSGDAEFLRRITLDLTGRIPSPATVTSFLADTNSSKRDALIDALMASSQFTDKWTMFFGDLFQNDAINSNIDRGVQGRDAFYRYIRDSIRQNKPYDQMAREMITATGDSFAVGQANWPVGNIISGGPVQDTYDGAAVDLGSMFLGISGVDCLLCHDGARHLDQINLWGANQTRETLWGLSAYFSRTSMLRPVPAAGILVSDVSTGGYKLDTNFGNRTPRQPKGTIDTILPRYPFSAASNSGPVQGENYREAIARQITGDLQFSRAIVNYVWEKLMVEAFVTPSNGFDLARLDPDNPPPAPWTLQPTNAQLLNRLARDFQTNGYNLRSLIAMIVKSSAYQLSSTYVGTWEPRYVPYYARKYVRRLDAEEIADAIVTATSTSQIYTFAAPSTLLPVQWAMQLPDTSEPRNDFEVAAFLNAFGRGDRDLIPRRSDGSILQAFVEMNHPFSLTRVRPFGFTTSRFINRVSELLKGSNDPYNLIRQVFLYTLSRPATDEEVNSLLPVFQQQGNQNGTSSLQWALLNRVEFLFNY